MIQADPAESRPEAATVVRRQAKPPAFAELYAVLYPKILRAMSGQTRDPHAALDLTSETFAKAFEKRASLRSATPEQAYAWIWAIARNELARYRRQAVYETKALARLGLERPPPSDIELTEIEQFAALALAREELTTALARLPQDQQDALRMRFYEDLGYEEAAQALGMSNDVVRARTSRGLRALAAKRRIRDAARGLDA
jgi:RNA polymerase sigma-70 factor (ECF subfamily)